MMKVLARDMFRYSREPYSPGAMVRCFLSHPGFRFVTMLRLCQRYGKLHPAGLLSRLYFRRLKVRYGFQIPFTCDIGAGLFIGHFGNIVVNQGVRIGENCNIAQGVTVGYASRGKRKGCPSIGDRVWIGANAVVTGNIKIGNDVLIAPLSFVNFDVPDHCVVSGNPAQIVSDKGSEGYVNNIT